MLTHVKRLFGSPSCMDMQIHLRREPPVYINVDTVCGHVLLTCETQVDIATATVKLSGSAVSRINTQQLTESHLLFKISEQLFPPDGCAGAFTSRSVTLPPGKHLFPFSIKLPPATQCYKSATPPQLRTQAPHLMRKLPPSTGDSSSPEEIKYVLEATIRQGGVIRAPRRTAREIYLRCRSTIDLPLHGQHAHVQRQRISYSTGHSEIKSRPLTYEVTIELLNGPFLSLGQPIPLAVQAQGMDGSTSSNNITLYDFQSMIFETTEVRARGAVERLTRSWIVQTMANLQQLFTFTPGDERNRGSVDDSLWRPWCVPLFLTPTFETCNVSRDYKLEIRLGIGLGRNNIRIVGFQFPVYIVSVSDSGLGFSAGIQAPAPELEYYRKEDMLEKEIEVERL